MSTVASGYEFKTRLRQGSKSEPNTDMEDKVKKQKLILCTDAVIYSTTEIIKITI